MNLQELHTIDFAAAGDAGGALAGWDQPVNGVRWARGPRSTIALPRPDGVADLVLLLTVEPFLFPPVLTQQLLRVLVNGRTVRLARLRERTLVACRIDPACLGEANEIVVGFEHTQMVQPNMVSASTDQRGYSVAFASLGLLRATLPAKSHRPPAQSGAGATELRPAASLSDAELMWHFASLGDNCEFGMAQRHFGAEPMDLLRFAGPSMRGLLHGLGNGFEGLDEIHDVEFTVYVAGGVREYILHQRKFELQGHTTVHEGDMPPARLFSRELKKFDLLRRLFVEDLTAAQRIFVFKKNDPTDVNAARVVFQLVRRWGPNTMLFVQRADAAHRAGTVEWIEEGLMRGYMDRFSPYDNAAMTPSPVWRDLCLTSYEMWRATRETAPEPQPRDAEPAGSDHTTVG